ncbi:sensor histidine kinase [Salisediminibacterium selenitireducens]|uniref:histidine kinase n=1 Tax=Bacillus selenitireducens (strain ATCC 700615 / DSM 15326 / MLS10) TaxID=439292 RepID=D6XWJ0_BACIE|nr:sensor histidine kinase [Salisediminibacterium selenitireducens]ADH97832.1 histidine kinase dimerization and phosphoacceptor region [[Bacillus] selenitireducens MLS10]
MRVSSKQTDTPEYEPVISQRLIHHQYWLWLGLLITAFGGYLILTPVTSPVMMIRYIAAGLFFALFFLLPLTHSYRKLSGAAMALFLAVAAYPFEAPALYLFLIAMIIYSGTVLYHLPRAGGLLLHTALFAAVSAGSWLTGGVEPLLITAVFGLLLIPVFILAFGLIARYEALKEEHQSVISAYRATKRQLVADEERARHDERRTIARELHDSVGHKLTALLMQLEVYRMSLPPAGQGDVDSLKELAKDSLSETRQAVKTLKHHEAAGLAAMIQLIRKLEAETMIHVQLTVRQGALTAPLSGDQAAAVYRAVQESLTNSMRHSGGREVSILFEVIGDTVFRFHVSNPVTDDAPLKEGFGLTAMRERITACGGQLTISKEADRFAIDGRLPLMKEGDDA